MQTNTQYNQSQEIDQDLVQEIEIEIVIARYNEDLEWIKAFTDSNVTLTVYNKGNPLPDDINAFLSNNSHTVIQLQNVGRESHTYLTHMLGQTKPNNHTKHTKPNNHVIVFTQGNINDHIPTTRARITDPIFASSHLYLLHLAKQALDSRGGLSSNHAPHDVGNMSAHWHLKLADKWPTLKDTNKTYGEWYEDVFQPAEFPRRPIRWYKNAIFAMTSKCLDTIPKSTLIQALKQVDDHIDPEAGHFMERSWYSFITL